MSLDRIFHYPVMLEEVKSLIKNNQDKSVIIRHDRKKKTNIFQEVNAAKKQLS